MPTLVQIAPLAEAVKKLGAKSVVPSTLRTRDWAGVPAEIRDRAFFSAGVEDARVLATMQERLEQAAGLVKEQTARGEAFVDRSSFIRELRKMAQDAGLGDGTKGLTDVAGRVRLGLIFDTNLQAAQGHARWKMDMDPDVLDAFPAQELIREEERKSPRDWSRRWVEAGGRVFGGRMIALKTDPVWAAISRFGAPWPPFDFNSGMGLQDIGRDEAEALGLIEPGQNVDQPGQTYFNEGLAAPTGDLPPSFLRTLRETFGNQIEISGDSIRWKGAA
jgi:hypothetical protein